MISSVCSQNLQKKLERRSLLLLKRANESWMPPSDTGPSKMISRISKSKLYTQSVILPLSTPSSSISSISSVHVVFTVSVSESFSCFHFRALSTSPLSHCLLSLLSRSLLVTPSVFSFCDFSFPPCFSWFLSPRVSFCSAWAPTSALLF